MVPKDGGNMFSAYAFSAFANNSMQGSNIDAGLRARGLSTVNAVDKVYDTNLALGGPLRKDKLWFFTSYRHWGVSQRMADQYFAKAPATSANGFAYIPDLSRPAYNQERENASSLRLTWQASPKNKVSASVDIQDSCSCTSNFAQTFIAVEASSYQVFAPSNLFKLTWTHPQTDKLLFEAGATTLVAGVPSFPQTFVSPSNISIVEQSTGYRYNAASTYALPGAGHDTGQWNQRFSVSYVTGSHNFKTGIFSLESTVRANSGANQDVNYALLNGRPAQITTTMTEAHVKDMGLYVQDQWTIKR